MKFIFAFTSLLCILTSIPYLQGYVMPAPGQAFTGILVHDADTYNYLAYAHEAALGQWLFHNPMTGEPHGNVFFNLEWLAIGKISSWLHLPLPAAMNLIRILSIALMCYSVYWLSSFLLRDRLTRRLALLACMAGGGFGWIVALRLFHRHLNSSYFLDLSVANFFPFHWALKLPHFLVAQTLTTLGLCFFLRGESQNKVRDYLYAGFFYVAAGACRPYDMVYLIAATGVYIVARFAWESERSARYLWLRTTPILICLPLLGYYYWIFKIHPVFRWWTQPGCPAPPVWQLAITYGLPLLLLPIALRHWLRHEITRSAFFILCCLGTSLLLIHLHGLLSFPFQFSTAILVPLVIVVLAGLQTPLTTWRKQSRWAAAILAGLILVNSLTSAALLGQAIVQVAKRDFRIDQKLLDAYAWLDGHSLPNDVVLANFDISNQLPSYTHNRVFFGYLSTVNSVEKGRQLREFLRPGASEEFRIGFLRAQTIRFVLLTPAEYRAMGNPDSSSGLKEIFRNDAAVVFAVKSGEAPRAMAMRTGE